MKSLHFAAFSVFILFFWSVESVAAVTGPRYSLSVDNRVGKTAYAAAEVAPLGSRVATGARLGYFLTADSVFEVSHVLFRDDVGTGSDADARQTVASLKTFFTNSLLAGAGAVHQRWDLPSGETSRTVVAAHVGNQWQWTLATVGCDWLSYLWPVQGAAADSDAASRFQFLRVYAGISF